MRNNRHHKRATKCPRGNRKLLGEIFSDENIYTTEQDIWEYLGNTAGQEAKKVKDNEREKMDEEITLTDIEETIKHLKKQHKKRMQTRRPYFKTTVHYIYRNPLNKN